MQPTTETTTAGKPEAKKRSTKRRGNGEGSIFQRADGRWVATINVGYNANGKRVRRTVYGWTKGEAQDKLTALHGQKHKGELRKASHETLAAYLERWLEDSVKIQRKPATHACYRFMVKKHINPRIGGVALTKLTPLNVERLYADMVRDGRSPRLVQLAHMVLHRALKLAVNPYKIIPFNPCQGLRPSAPRPEIDPLTPQQALALLESTAGDRMHALYVLAVLGGLRQGELFGLKWDDIDFEAGTVTVRRTLIKLVGSFTTSDPKTAKGRRTIKLPGVAINALRDHQRIVMAEGLAGQEWVFLSRKGNHLRANGIRGMLRKSLKAAGLPMVRFHALRHTCATLMMGDGVPARVVQEILGHADVSITLGTYSHVTQTMQDEACDKMQARFQAIGG